jgi:hypothetical protein
MRNLTWLRLGISLIVFFLLPGCDVPPSIPTPTTIVTRVVEERTRPATETAIRATLTMQAPTATPTLTPVSTATTFTLTSPILLKQGRWKGLGDAEFPVQMLDPEWVDCWQDRITLETRCPRFSVFFVVHDDNRITVRGQEVIFRPYCVSPGVTLRPFGIHSGITLNVTGVQDKFQFDFGFAKVFGRMTAPNRIEGTFQAKTGVDTPNYACAELNGVWIASPE